MVILLILALLFVLFWVGYHVTGALLSAAFWLLVKLPVALMLFALGLALCATLLLIPFGVKCFGLGMRVLF